MKQVTVLGWHGYKNIGDDSYTLAFPLLFPNYQFVFTDKLYKKEEIVILGGGDVMNPCFLSQLEKFKPVKKYAMSVDIAHPRNDFDLVIPRNTGEMLDFAFVLQPNKTKGQEIINRLFVGADLYQKKVVIVMNNFLVPDENTLSRDYLTFEKACYDLARLMDSTSASFILLPFGNGFPRNDRIPNSILYSRCKFWKKNLVVYEQLDAQQTLDVCSAVDAVITTRLHGGIFSCIGGTPFIDLTHHSKTKFFLETIQKPEFGVNYWSMDINAVRKLLDEFLSKDCRLHIADKARQRLIEGCSKIEL